LDAVHHPDGRGHVERPADHGAEERGRGHPDDGEWDSVQGEGAADHVGRSRQSALPEGVADDGHRAVRPTVAKVVVRGQGAPENRGHPHEFEEAATDPEAFGKVGLATVGEIELCVRGGGGAGQETCPAGARICSQMGFVQEPPSRRTRRVGFRTGNDRRIRLSTRVKMGRVGADAQSEGQDRDQGEGGALEQDGARP